MFPNECYSTSSVSSLKLHHNSRLLFGVGHAGTQPAFRLINSCDFRSKFSLPRVSCSNLILECRRGSINGCFSYVTSCRCSYSTVGWISSSFLAMVLANICHFYRKAEKNSFRCLFFCTHNRVRRINPPIPDIFLRYQWMLLAQAVNHGWNCLESDQFTVIIVYFFDINADKI